MDDGVDIPREVRRLDQGVRNQLGLSRRAVAGMDPLTKHPDKTSCLQEADYQALSSDEELKDAEARRRDELEAEAQRRCFEEDLARDQEGIEGPAISGLQGHLGITELCFPGKSVERVHCLTEAFMPTGTDEVSNIIKKYNRHRMSSIHFRNSLEPRAAAERRRVLKAELKAANDALR